MNAKSRTGFHQAAILVAGAALLLPAAGCQKPNPVLVREGKESLALHDEASADRTFTQAVKQNPADWKSQYYVGVIRNRQKRGLDAQLAFEKALTLRNKDKEFTPLILDGLAESIYQQDQPASLTAMLQKACDEYGTVPDYLRQAKWLGKIGDVDGAKLAFRKALKFAAKDDAQPYLAMADFFETVGNTQGAITALGKAYYITPRSKSLPERFRRYGLVPGPTLAIPPKDDESELISTMDSPH